MFGWLKRNRAAWRESNAEAASARSEEARKVADDVDQALRQHAFKLTCPRCKGTDFKYLELYGLWQCTRDWCGYLMEGVQNTPSSDSAPFRERGQKS